MEDKLLKEASIEELKERIAEVEKMVKRDRVSKILPDIKKIILDDDTAVGMLSEYKKVEMSIIMKHLPDCLENMIAMSENEIEAYRAAVERRAETRKRRAAMKEVLEQSNMDTENEDDDDVIPEIEDTESAGTGDWNASFRRYGE